VPDNLLDLPLLLQIIQRLSCKTAIDLKSVDQGCNGDEAVGLDIFVELIGGGFIEDDCMIGLILDWREWSRQLTASIERMQREDISRPTFAFRPLLLLLLASSRCGSLSDTLVDSRSLAI